MPPIRILVVDDAVVMRRIISDALSGDSDIEVVGTAANGKIAIAKIEQLNPDLVTLDIEMPEMDGLQTIAAIRKIRPTLPVIMFSAVSDRGAAASLEALALGANDYVTKPSATGGVSAGMQRIRDELIPRVKALCRRESAMKAAPPIRPVPQSPPAAPAAPKVAPRRVDVAAIGVSTGGPNALASVLPKLPANLSVPIVIVQHMPALFTRFLAERLNATSNIEIREAKEGDPLRPGQALIAPGDFHLELVRAGTEVRAKLHQGPPENSCRPAVDVLFRSVAQVFGNKALGIILTGMGQDGLRGCQALAEQGAQIVAQDEATSVVWGMPGYVSRAGLAQRVVPLESIAEEIIARASFRVPVR